MACAAPTLAALLKALRRADTASAAFSATEQAVDRLIASASLSESQYLVLGMQDCAKDNHSAPFTESLYAKLQQAAAICSEPSGKAQYLGFVLLQAGVHLLETLEVSIQRQVLLKVFNANNGVLSGYVAALTASDGPFLSYHVDYSRVKKTLEIVSPVLKCVLMDTKQSEGHKIAVLDALSRIAWHFDGQSEGHKAVRTAVSYVLVQALELVPHAQLPQASYAVHVALTVDLLSSLAAHSKEQVALAERTAKFVLESTQILIGKGEGVLALLQSLEQLAQAVPEALWCSVFLTSSAYFLLDTCETPVEQRLMLRVLSHALEFGRHAVSGDRGVYVEILLLPLSSMISLHGSAVSELLKLVTEIKSASKYRAQQEIEEQDSAPTETSTHARSAVRLISDEGGSQRWLSSLFQSEAPNSPDSTDKWLALLLVALLSDERSSLRGCAAKCLERQVNTSPKFWGADSTKALVASVVFLVSQHPLGNAKTSSTRGFGEWMASCLYSLAALAATTTDTMRIVLRLIDSMNGTARMRSVALKLMYEVWRNESRVFPRLETMLLESTDPEEDVERHVIKMATIKTLCEKEPELGVQFISSIQGFLEDELESVVSMAMDAITALCGGDCLDFYVAFKIIAQKMRKSKVTCADGPLFQERLCCFYALGGAESAANEKHASKLLGQAWEFADSEHSNVRKAAYAALCKFPLDMLGLSMPGDDGAGQDSDDDDQVTEEEVEEQLDDLMQRLQNEHDSSVRVEIENLVAKVIEQESAKLTAGVGRGQRMASAAAGQQQTSQQTGPVVSAAATKEMKALLPSRTEVQASTTGDWSGFLLAYQPKAVIDAKNVKRKDKLVRLATQNVDELVETVSIVLQSMELPWVSTGVSPDERCAAFLRIQALMGGWRGFMATFASSLDELAGLKTPVGVDDADVAFRVFSEGVADMMNSLLNDNANKIGGALAAGALAGQLCDSRHWQNPQLRVKYEETVGELSRRLALSMEQARVFSADDSDARVSSMGFLLALQLSFGRRKVDASEGSKNFITQLEKIEEMLMELYRSTSDHLLGSCALLGRSHIAALYTNGEGLETFEATQWRQQRVKPIADGLLMSFLLSDRAKQAMISSSSVATVFPLDERSKADSPIEKVSAEYDQGGSSDAILLRWVSLVGLARLASGFSSIRRLDWLANLQKALAAVWEVDSSASTIAVALGPVLLECAHFNLAPSCSLERFVASCIERAAASVAEGVDKGLLMMAAAHVLCRSESLGGFPDTVQNQTKLVVEQIQRTLEGESGQGRTVRALMVSGIANFFHLAFGFSGVFASTKQKLDGDVELSLDSDTIRTLVKLARAESKRSCAYSSAVLGAIARAADGFYVSQKKKSFDVEVRSVPTNTMLSKALEWLRQTNPSAGSSNTATAIADNQIAESLLSCLAATGSVLPLLDYSSLTHRVMLRFCSATTSAACVRFAATQGSCDELLTSEFLSSTWFANADSTVQAELIASLSLAATRLPTDVLRALLMNLFDVLKDIWRRDTSSSSSVLLFDSYTGMLREVLTSSRRIPEASLDMVSQVIREEMVVELPFGLRDARFVEQFATRVLSKVDYGERSIADTFLMPSALNSSTWSWWRNGVFTVELAKRGVFTISKREASLAFQWILRHGFEEWTDDTPVGTYLQPLVARIGALITQHTRPGENVSALLDVIDELSRGMSSLDFSTRADFFKRRVLFDVMACVLSWSSSLSHERYLMDIPRAEIAKVDTASDLLPFGLMASAHSAKTVSAIGERLLALQRQLTSVTANEAREYAAALDVCSRQMYIAAESWQIPGTMPGEIREFWSLRDAN